VTPPTGSLVAGSGGTVSLHAETNYVGTVGWTEVAHEPGIRAHPLAVRGDAGRDLVLRAGDALVVPRRGMVVA
jgi:hypothetical protein